MVDKSKFTLEGYNVSMIGKNFQPTDAEKAYVLEKLSKLDRFSKDIIEVIITFEIQKLAHTVSIVLKFLNHRIQVHSSMENIYSAIDLATAKLLKLVNRYRSRLHHYRVQDATVTDLKVNVLGMYQDEVAAINDEIEAKEWEEKEEKYKMHSIVATETLPLKVYTQDEAVMHLEFSDKPFLIYISEEHQKLRIIYKKDDAFAIVEVE